MADEREGRAGPTAYVQPSFTSEMRDNDRKVPVEFSVEPDGPRDMGKLKPSQSFAERVTGLADGWFLEYISVFVSAVTLVGLCLVLWHFDGKPLPKWTFGSLESVAGKANHITLNSIISLLATTASATIGYPLTKALGQLTWIWFRKSKRQLADMIVFHDAANKSPIGGLKLIYMLKGRHFAVIGAVVVICLHLYQFFTQQLIQIEQGYWADDVNTPSAAEVQTFVDKIQNGTLDQIPRSLQVARIANESNYSAVDYGQPPFYSVDTPLKGNLWAALYDSGINGDWAVPSFYCATGNCTYQGYATIGVCSRCANLSSEIIKSCTPQPTLDLTNTTAGCDVLLPNGFSLGGPERNRTNLMAVSTSYKPLLYANYTSPLAVVHSIVANDTFFANESTSISAMECALIPCVITYDYAMSYNDPKASQAGVNSVPLYEYPTQIHDNYTFNTSAFPWDGPAITIPANDTLNTPTLFMIDSRAYSGLQSYLTSLFNGFATSDGTSVTYHDASTANASRPITNTANADAMQAIFKPFPLCEDLFGAPLPDRVACSMSALAVGLTTAMRGTAPFTLDFSTTQALGYTYYPKPTLEVAWLWLVPITALWLLSTVLLVGTVIKTRRAGIRHLGLSPLALLFLGVEDEEETPHETAAWWHSEAEAKRKAERMRVQLDLSGRRASLVKGVSPAGLAPVMVQRE